MILRLALCCFAMTSFAAAKVPVEAKQHLDAGLAYVDDPSGPRYEEAYREFHAAYESYASYELLANIGTCSLYLERDAEAISAYEKYLEKATDKDISAKKRAQMERDIKTLKIGLVQVAITTTPAKVTLIDERFATQGKSVVNRYEVTDGKLALGIHPGSHRLTVHLDGYEDQRWEFDAKPASQHEHAFQLIAVQAAPTLPPPPSASSKSETRSNGDATETVPSTDQSKVRRTPTSVYIGLAATGVFTVAATVTGLMANSKKSDLVAINDGTEVNRARDLHDAMNRYALVSDITLGAAVVSAGVTGYLYLTRPSSSVESGNQKQAIQNQRFWRVLPAIGSERAGITFSSQF